MLNLQRLPCAAKTFQDEKAAESIENQKNLCGVEGKKGKKKRERSSTLRDSWLIIKTQKRKPSGLTIAVIRMLKQSGRSNLKGGKNTSLDEELIHSENGGGGGES